MDRSVHQLDRDLEQNDRVSIITSLIAIRAMDDLTLLTEGSFGRPQRRSLILSRLGAFFGTIAMALAVGLFIALGIDQVRERPAFPMALVILVMTISAVFMWLLRDSLMLFVRIGRDLRDCRSSSVYGEIWTSHSMRPGFVRLPRYHIKVEGRRFVVKHPIFEQFRPNRHYRVFFAPHSGCFLGAMASELIDLPPVAAVPAPAPITVPPTTDFTLQEREILRLIAAGLSNKEIAARMSLSVNTIKMYCSQIYLKLDVHRRTEAVARAREIGLL